MAVNKLNKYMKNKININLCIKKINGVCELIKTLVLLSKKTSFN